MQKTKLSLTVFLLLGAIKLDAIVGGGFGGGGFGRGGGKIGLAYSTLSKAVPRGGRRGRDEDKNIATPLSAAVKNNDLEMVRLLLSHGADVDALGAQARIAAFHTKEPNINLVDMLIKAYVKQGHKHKAQYLLYGLVNGLASGEFGGSEDRRLAIMRTLIEAGFNVNYSPSLLIGAAEAGNKSMIEFLLKVGAKRGLKDASGKIARDYTHNEELKMLLTPPSTLAEDVKKKLGF